MKRGLAVLVGATLVSAPAAAQWHDVPVWNSPKGGSGIGVYADYSSGNGAAGDPSAYGLRGSAGFGNIMVTLGYTSADADFGSDNNNSFGGNVAFRLIGGSLTPVAVNLQGGAARIGEANGAPAFTRGTLGGGVSASLPLPLSIEPYFSLTNRWYFVDGDDESNIGWTLGANATFGLFGLHLAYDSESGDGLDPGVFGIGAHVTLKMPGM
jgi:hypothetical protein